MGSQIDLLKTQRFLPLFLVQFFGAFNDNLLKTVLVVLIAYGLWDIGGWDPAVLVAVAAGLFIVPFILFCPLAGSLNLQRPSNCQRAARAGRRFITV